MKVKKVDRYEAVKVLTEKVAKLFPYKIDVEVKPADRMMKLKLS